MKYKPYSVEWSRKRYLSEAIHKYFEDNVSTENIIDDIVDILNESEVYYKIKSDKFKIVKDNFLINKQ